jgi:pimeloyl-ACP methyl ester carboxylesterase
MRPPEPSRIVPARAGVAVYERGAGEPVLLVGGFPDHAIGLVPLAESLAAAGFRAIVAAYPGYAPSEPLPDDDYSIPAVSADLLAVMDALDAPRFSVVGHGWGALYGYLMATLYPERIDRLVGIAAPHPAGFERRHRLYVEQKTVVYAYLLAYASNAEELAMDRAWLTSLAHTWSPGLWRADWTAVLDLVATPAAAHATHRYYRADMEGRGPETGRIAAPTTVIYGTQSQCIRPALFAGLDGWFDAPLHQHPVDEAGHWPHLERPGVVLPLVEAGLRRMR